jgi:hypothetical protein
MMEKLPLYRMLIADDIDGEEEVDFVALVESPAIQRNFLAFGDQFVEPTQGESKTDFMPRCIEYIINEGKESEQAVAICSSLWEQHFAEVQVIVCKECGHSWELQEGGQDPYICHMCGADNSPAKEKFSAQLTFAVQDEDQRIVSGPLMIADMPIYRRDEDGHEYYVMFTKEEIKKIAQRFFKKGYQAKVNIEHGKQAEGVYMFESYLIDRERGVYPPKGFEDSSEGSWFVSYKFDNKELWKGVKNGDFKGLSVEGLFRYEKAGEMIGKEEQIMAQIFKILEQIEQ